jgi:hypothetical protein
VLTAAVVALTTDFPQGFGFVNRGGFHECHPRGFRGIAVLLEARCYVVISIFQPTTQTEQLQLKNHGKWDAKLR